MVMVNVLGILGTVKAGVLPCRGAETVHLSALRCSVGTRVLLQYNFSQIVRSLLSYVVFQLN